MSEQIVSVTYSLQRREPVARNIKTDEEVFAWVYVRGSDRSTLYPEDEMKKTGWRQLKTTIIEEVIEVPKNPLCGCGTELQYGENSKLYYCSECDIELLYDEDSGEWDVVS